METENRTFQIEKQITELQLLEKNSRKKIKEIITQNNSSIETNDKDYVFYFNFYF